MAKRGFQGAVLRGFGARDHRAVVLGTELLAPGFLRVRLRSDTLFDDAVPFPTAWLRFWFPDPDGGDVEHQRAYTITEADETTGEFAVDVVLHEPAGPASAWAVRVSPGDTIALTSLGAARFDVPEELPAGYLLIGDSASIPAIGAIIAALPADVPIELYLEEHDEEERLIPLPAHPLLRLHRVPRRGPGSLAAALEDRDWSDWSAWAATESGTLKQVRARLKDDFGFPRSAVHAQAYWYYGRAMGTLRATGAPEVVPEEVAADRAAEAPRSAEDRPAASVPAADAPAGAPRGRWRSQGSARLLAPLRPTFVVAGVVQGLVTLLQLAPFVLLAELARRILDGAAADELWTLGIVAVALMALGALLASALVLWVHSVDARFARGLRARLLDRLGRLPLGWFRARGSGQVKQIVQDDALALHYLVTHAVPDAVAAVVAPVAVLLYLFWVDTRLALVLLIPVLVYVVLMWAMIIRSGSKIAQAARWSERMTVEATAFLDGQQVVRVFPAASGFRARLDEYLAFLGDWQRPFTRTKTAMDLATRPATFLVLIVVVGALLVTGGAAAPTVLLPFLLLGTTFGVRLLGIGYGLSGLRNGLLAAQRLSAVLDEPVLAEPAQDGTGSVGPAGSATAAGRVEFDGVSFGYRTGVPVLHDIALVLEPGTLTALVGPSGSGKSTLAALLARFHDVDAGAIRIDGRDVRDLAFDDLYAQVGFVLQDSRLVHGTVRENIALGVPDASDAEIEAVARAARIHDRILRLPDGYGTVLGPDAALSGGERQRITIARALLADPPVLVLDEATASADPESEHLVQQALSALTADRTVLVIAHRLHTVVDADRIVVLDGGRIVESGTHAALLGRTGRYRDLWDARGAHPAPAEDGTAAASVEEGSVR